MASSMVRKQTKILPMPFTVSKPSSDSAEGITTDSTVPYLLHSFRTSSSKKLTSSLLQRSLNDTKFNKTRTRVGSMGNCKLLFCKVDVTATCKFNKQVKVD